MIQLQPEFNRTDPLFPYTTLFRSPTGAPDYLFKTSQPDESVRQASETAMREIVGKKPMDFVLYSGRTEVATEVQGLAQSILDRSEEHTSELQSLMRISYAVYCLKKKIY